MSYLRVKAQAYRFRRMVMTLNQIAIREIRAELGRQNTSQRQLARRLGCSDMLISTRLRGVKPLSLDELEAIAMALGIPAQQLIWPERLAV